MSIAPFTSTQTGHKSAGALGKAGHGGQDGQAGQAGADSALGFLAQLAAAVGSVGPLGQTLAVPGMTSGLPGGAPGEATPTAGTTTAAADALTQSPTTGLPTALLSSLDDVTAAQPGAGSGTIAQPGGTPFGRLAGQLGLGARSATTAPTGASAATQTAQAATQPTSASAAAAPTTPGSTADVSTLTADLLATAAGDPAPHRHASAATGADTNGADTTSSASTSTLTASSASATDPSLVPVTTPLPGASPDAASSIAAVTDSLAAAATSTSATSVVADQQPEQTAAVLRQVFPEVTKVAASGQGTHRLAITLHPEDLGEVRVTVVVRAGSVQVNVATDPVNGAARTALEHGAPELRRLLEAVGTDAEVRFREFGTGTTPNSTTGGATDGGRQQSQTFAQAQAQADTGSGGRGRAASYASTDQPTPRDTSVASESDPSVPTARRATSGVDQLI
ncbi:flagellar hook-length control protein FliK [Nocardioides sp. Iso805N]|uniref:flagellar hook-length control protein FliK n=1 Tax=Nocardioides sp. Iso805N TaxID=1283287 RepID=UPI000366FA49|nr:flagellar hook-length control protein FliK [Nocardioides sp. Iso805N]